MSEPLLLRFGEHSITENEVDWILHHVAMKVGYEQNGRFAEADLNDYVMINKRADVNERVMTPPMRRVYTNFAERRLGFSGAKLVHFLEDGSLPLQAGAALTGCLTLEGEVTAMYEKDISMRGLEIVNNCDEVYLERYTSLLQCSFQDLAKFYGREITLADRSTAENGMEKIVEQAKNEKVAFLVIGDPFSATTHVELYRLAKEQNVDVEVVHNASVLTAVGITGLQLYKFGKTTSVPFLDDFPTLETPYHVLKDNLSLGYHTLLLLDIKEDLGRFMTVKQGLEVLEDIEKRVKGNIVSDELFVIGCARLGSKDFVIKSGTLAEIKKFDFGSAPHCLIVPGKMHFSEEEIVTMF